MPILFFCKKVMLPIVFVSFSSFLFSFAGKYLFSYVSLRSFIVIPITAVLVCAMTLAFGMDTSERKTIFFFVKKRLRIRA
jgi:hypothetical protein